MRSATAYGHAQGEAYMLMTYRCVGHPETGAPVLRRIRGRDHDVLGPLGPEGAAAYLAQGDLDPFGSVTPDLVVVTSEVRQWLLGGGY